MWLWKEKNVHQKIPKKKKRRKGQNKVVYKEVEGEMRFKQMFTHVLGFSNHKHIAWGFVQENKQSLSRCPLAIYKTPWKELVFHSEDWDGAWQLWTLPRVEEAKWAISWAESLKVETKPPNIGGFNQGVKIWLVSSMVKTAPAGKCCNYTIMEAKLCHENCISYFPSNTCILIIEGLFKAVWYNQDEK